MRQVMERYPDDGSPELLLATAAQYQKRIDESSDDIFRQAEMYFERGKLFALYGRCEEAVSDFDDAAQRVQMSIESELREVILEQIDAHIRPLLPPDDPRYGHKILA
jgi:hypothetical protein